MWKKYKINIKNELDKFRRKVIKYKTENYKISQFFLI